MFDIRALKIKDINNQQELLIYLSYNGTNLFSLV